MSIPALINKNVGLRDLSEVNESDRYQSAGIDSSLARRARLLSVAGDETRIQIFCFFFAHGEGCVSDIAKNLGVSVNTASHHLRIMRDVGLLVSKRTGVSVCYTLVRDEFMNSLEKTICG